ncbi:SCO-spondin-like [Branchiostoma floridae]|uniref:SCO-spondin-like n=1 Tax=Branchiostoma floridae TaxID=7739 RepID=A0A9J7LLF1_BRAFL|nr:SCO-spondin-like [Branchiostoma floridae]XP_035685061.1 SCO-spondin-like [Branchiostoma floridae]
MENFRVQGKRLCPFLLFLWCLCELCSAFNNTTAVFSNKTTAFINTTTTLPSTTTPSTTLGCFLCDENQRCIPDERVCDDLEDCDDRTDELNCSCEWDQFRCDNGLCIPDYLTCDGRDDCGDWSDERACACTRWEYACANGRCIRKTQECDDRDDCGDASDELHCACPSHKQKCATYGCITSDEECDGLYQCEDKSDEENCLPELRWDVWLEIGVAIFFVLIFSIVCAATRCCMGPPKSHSPRRRQQGEDPGLELANIGQSNPSFDDNPPAYDACVVPDTIWTTSQSGLPGNPAVSCPDIVIVHNDNIEPENTQTRSTQSVNNVNTTGNNNTDSVSETVSVASTLPAYDDYTKYPTAPPDGEVKHYITDGASPLQSVGSSVQSVS